MSYSHCIASGFWHQFAMITLCQPFNQFAVVISPSACFTFFNFSFFAHLLLGSRLIGFNLNEDVVGATFMAAAASSPELFINSVGTFITKSDLGVGAIVGSAVFNVLAVPACCGLFAGKVNIT